ncbi:hypothetical protein B296_00056404 [Ensete ventricosum]|uniref:Uncharacterized protein n=1 Tax=Ensete ventricosum TaxID=4639 RepID=A0A426XC10_ENSVE|nr:hypothetical protein B296_00056404 [Ensete ventricosum]
MQLTRQQKDHHITDPETYTTTSEDHIDAKLRPLRRIWRIDYTLLTEFRLGQSPSPRRSQCSKSFDRKENLLEKEGIATDSPYPRTKVEYENIGDQLVHHTFTVHKYQTREDPPDRSAKGLCQHCDMPWSYDHCCKKGRLLMIEPIEEPEHEEEDLEPKDDTKEDP